MGNTTKTYTINIQMDAAQQELADTTKKLAALDAKLEGLDRNSDAAKAIVSEMAKLAKQAESAEAQVRGLNARLDGLKPGTIGALRAELLELKAALDLTVEGSEEANRVLVRMGEVKGEIKGLRDEVKALDPEQRINAFNNLASGVVGAFGVMTVAAETFGLESSTADEFVKKTQGVIAVLSSLEAIRNSLDGETIKSIKSTLALGKAYITAGEGASTGSKVTKAALISTGIGALVVLVGVLIANWDRLTDSVKGSEAFFTKIKAVTSGLFDAFIAQVKLGATLLADLFSGNIAALVTDAREGGKKVGEAYSKGYAESVAESHRKELQGLIEQQDRRIKILKASGVDTEAVERDNLQRRVNAQKQGTKEYIEALSELGAFDRAAAKKRADDGNALEAARLSGLLALQQAQGKASYQQQLDVELQKLAALKSAANPQLAAIEAQQDAITALVLAKEKEQADKRRALQAAQLQGALAIRTAQGGEEYRLALDQNRLQEKLAEQHLATLRAAGQRDEAAEVAALTEVNRLKIERAGLYYAEQKRVEKAAQDAIFDLHEFAYQRDVAAKTKHDKEEAARLAAVNAAAQRVAADVAAQTAERARLAAIPPLSFTDNMLVRLFGVSPEQLDITKQRIAEAAQNISDLVSGIFSAEQSEADQRIADAQSRVQELDKQYQDAARASEETAKQLDGAKGARRDFLLQKLEKERAAEARFAAEKAKAAKEQEQAAKARAALDKQQQQISAASSAIEAVLLGIQAAKAIASAAEKGKVGYDNIALAIGAAAALVAGFIAVKNAAKLENGGELRNEGGEIQGGSHASGNDIPVLGGRYRVEGKEMITNVRSTENNRGWLHFINRVGKTRALTAADFMAQEAANVRVLPPSGSSLGNGGELGGGSNLPTGAVVVQSADLAELVNTNQQLIGLTRELVGHAAVTAAKPPIGREGAIELRKMADEVDESEALATL